MTGDGAFSHPADVHHLYDKVRSNAVHGELAPEVQDQDLTQLAWSVRRAINQFLQYAQENNYTRRTQLTKGLDEHEQAQELTDWLIERDPQPLAEARSVTS